MRRVQISRTISIVALSCLCFQLTGQRNCDFKIDTASILHNRNLDNLLTEFKKGDFIISNDCSNIPPFIRIQLDCFTNGFSIANPGKPYQSTDMSFKDLPHRQLVFLAKSNSMLVLTYYKGGIATSRHVLFIKYKGEKITDFWSGNCLNGMDTRAGIINGISKNRNKEGILNRKKIYI